MDWLFDTSPFVPRWLCGSWEKWHGNLVIWSDIIIALAYLSIPITIGIIAQSQGAFRHPKARWIAFLFMGFILLCGASHALDAQMFYVPMYRLFAVERAVTALFSLGAAFALPHLCKRLSIRWEAPGPSGGGNGK